MIKHGLGRQSVGYTCFMRRKFPPLKGKQERKQNNSRNARKETNPNVILIKVNVSGKVTVLEFTRETERIGQTDRCVC